MQIGTIQVREFKGQTRDITLTGCDIVAGPNGSGKSTIIQAILCGLAGAAGKADDRLRPYLGPEPTGRISIGFGSGMIARDLTWGDTSKEVAGVKGVGGVRAKVRELFGVAPVAHDLADFAAGTDKARAEILRGICDAAGASKAWTPAKIGEVLREACGLAPKPAEIPDGHPLSRLFAAVPAKDRPVGTWLEDAIAWAREEFTASNRAAKDSAAAAKPPADGDEIPAGDLATHRAAEATAAAELADVDRTLAALESAARLARERGAEGERLARAVGEAEDCVRRAESALAEARAIPAPDADSVQSQLAAAEADLGAARQTEAEAAEWQDEADRSLSAASEAAARAAARVAALEPLVAGTDECRCQSCGVHDPLGLGQSLTEAAVAAESARDALRAAEGEAKLAREERDRAAGLVRAAEGAIREIQAHASRAAREAESRSRTIAGAEAATQRATADLARAEEPLSAWQARASDTLAGPTGDRESLVAQREAIRSRLSESRRAVEAHVRREERETARQDAITRREETAAAFEAVKALGAALKALQSRVAAEAYRPIEEAAGAFLQEAGLDLRVRFRSESDFGAENGRGYRPFWSLSDSERALVGVGISVAFARLSGQPWRGILLDRAEAIDATRLPGVLRALAAGAKRGDWQAVIALVATEPGQVPAVEGAAVHWLGTAAAEGVAA